MPLPFLTAHWRNLIVCNYEVHPDVLAPYLPLGTELDTFQGKSFVSVVAFHFTKMKLFGLFPAVPVTNFEELNLRFYVTRKVGAEVRRGVVFVKEFVPSRIVASTARLLYEEPYEARPMFQNSTRFSPDAGGLLSYGLQTQHGTVSVTATTRGAPQPLRANSLEHFILEHYWGYTKRENGTTSEYRVAHAPWQYWEVASVTVSPELAKFYPPQLAEVLRKPPHSSFVALGSPVSVHVGRRIQPAFDISLAPSRPKRGWVLYDSQCGFCSWWAAKITGLLGRTGFDTAPLQADWVQSTIPLSSEELTNDLRILTSNGNLISGADAYRYGMKRIWWLAPLGLLLSTPGFRALSTAFYRVFNRNRFRISRACKLTKIEDISKPTARH